MNKIYSIVNFNNHILVVKNLGNKLGYIYYFLEKTSFKVISSFNGVFCYDCILKLKLDEYLLFEMGADVLSISFKKSEIEIEKKYAKISFSFDQIFNNNYVTSRTLIYNSEGVSIKQLKSLFDIEAEKTLWTTDDIFCKSISNAVISLNTYANTFTGFDLLTGAIIWQNDVAFYGYEGENFEYLTSYKNEIICIINYNKFIAVDIDNGNIIWEINSFENEVGETIKIYDDSLNKFRYIISDCGRYIYELNLTFGIIDLQERTYKVKLNWDITKAIDIWVQTQTFYKGKIYFAGNNYVDDNLGTVYKIGIFNIDTCKFELIQDVVLSKRNILNKAPIVDDTHFYIIDSDFDAYIFELKYNENGVPSYIPVQLPAEVLAVINPPVIEVPKLAIAKPDLAIPDIDIAYNFNMAINILKVSELLALHKEDDYDDKALINYYKTTNTDDYIGGTISNFSSLKSYIDIIKCMAILGKSNFNLTSISATKKDSLFSFTVIINDTIEILEFTKNKQGVLQNEFLDAFNSIVNKYVASYKFVLVYASGIDEADESFQLVFLHNDIIKALEESEFGYFDE